MQKKVTILTKEDQLNKQRFEAAILQLKTQHLIKRDSDIADDLEYSRAIISQYKNGIKPVTYAFIKRFEEFYKLKLSNFDVDQPAAVVRDPITNMLILIAKKLGATEKEISKALNGSPITQTPVNTKKIPVPIVNRKVNRISKKSPVLGRSKK